MLNHGDNFACKINHCYDLASILLYIICYMR